MLPKVKEWHHNYEYKDYNYENEDDGKSDEVIYKDDSTEFNYDDNHDEEAYYEQIEDNDESNNYDDITDDRDYEPIMAIDEPYKSNSTDVEEENDDDSDDKDYEPIMAIDESNESKDIENMDDENENFYEDQTDENLSNNDFYDSSYDDGSDHDNEPNEFEIAYNHFSSTNRTVKIEDNKDKRFDSDEESIDSDMNIERLDFGINEIANIKINFKASELWISNTNSYKLLLNI